MSVQPGALVGLRSRARIAPFRLHRPSTIEGALDVMAGADPEAAYMAGGIDLIGAMKAGFTPGDVIHIAHIEALRRIDENERTIRIGACATHRDIGESKLIQSRAPALAKCWRQIANPRVRCKGTVGGNIMARQAGYDATLMLMAANAEATVIAADRRRMCSAISDAPSLRGLLTSIAVPDGAALRLRADRSLHPALVVVLGFREDHGAVTRLHVAVGGAYMGPYAAPLGVPEAITPAALSAQSRALAHAFVSRLPAPATDWRASGAYRARMVGVLLERLLRQEGDTSC
jgi:carbon-monoxide dehydrogenase medium subunit